MKQLRPIKQLIKGMPSTDGDGVQLTRIIGTPYLDMLDPFLLLDAFGSDKPQDYIGGFPSHPHRGFETVTYMLAGKMRHKDNAGNEGVIEAGGVQWMTAGKGIIHSEMPEQEQGLLAGFQLWVNLPASHKMTEPRYQENSKQEIPVEVREGCKISVIAGTTKNNTQGVVNNKFVDPNYWHVSLTKNSALSELIAEDHNAFIYVIEGSLSVVAELDSKIKSVTKGELAIFGSGNEIELLADEDVEFLVISGRPLNEPIERAGPFVMNTKEEIHQAFADYRSGQF